MMIGKMLNFSLFGESHGEYIGIVIEGLPAGLKLDLELIGKELTKRRPHGAISTTRVEKDQYKIVSGYFNGYTCGTPLTVLIPNSSHRSRDYDDFMYVRPSHADYVAHVKTNGYNDYRGGGHFSGRITAPLVFLGAICKQLLLQKGIKIASQIAQVGNICDDSFNYESEQLAIEMEKLSEEKFPCLNQERKAEMLEYIKQIKDDNDSIGGKITTIVTGLPIGLGDAYFESVESKLSYLIYGVPAIKAVSFGLGEDYKTKRGSEVKDEYRIENNQVKVLANNNGGVLGGITTGEPLVINSVIKPTPTIGKAQKTVDIFKMKNVEYAFQGRHDPCIVHRAYIVIESVIAYGLVDLYLSKYGSDGFNK